MGESARREHELGRDTSREELLGAHAAALLEEALDVGEGLRGIGERASVVGQDGRARAQGGADRVAVAAARRARQELEAPDAATGAGAQLLELGGVEAAARLRDVAQTRVDEKRHLVDREALGEEDPAVEASGGRRADPEPARGERLREPAPLVEVGVGRDLGARPGSLAGGVVEVEHEDARPLAVDAAQRELAGEVLDEEGTDVAPARAARPAPASLGIRRPDGDGPPHVRGHVGKEELAPEGEPPPSAGDVALAEPTRELVEGRASPRGRSLRLTPVDAKLSCRGAQKVLTSVGRNCYGGIV